jgi:hypothetical protein
MLNYLPFLGVIIFFSGLRIGNFVAGFGLFVVIGFVAPTGIGLFVIIGLFVVIGFVAPAGIGLFVIIGFVVSFFFSIAAIDCFVGFTIFAAAGFFAPTGAGPFAAIAGFAGFLIPSLAGRYILSIWISLDECFILFCK